MYHHLCVEAVASMSSATKCQAFETVPLWSLEDLNSLAESCERRKTEGKKELFSAREVALKSRTRSG